MKITMPDVFFLCQTPQNYARSGIHYAKLRPLVISRRCFEARTVVQNSLMLEHEIIFLTTSLVVRI